VASFVLPQVLSNSIAVPGRGWRQAGVVPRVGAPVAFCGWRRPDGGGPGRIVLDRLGRLYATVYRSAAVGRIGIFLLRLVADLEPGRRAPPPKV